MAKSRHGLGSYIAALLAVNVLFAAIGLLWRHPAGLPGWWVTWIVADVAALSAIAMAAAGRPLQLTWDRMFAWVFICVNVGALISLVAVSIWYAIDAPSAVFAYSGSGMSITAPARREPACALFPRLQSRVSR